MKMVRSVGYANFLNPRQQSLGLLALFIYSNGVIPKEVKENVFQCINLELVQLLQQMLHNDPVVRPTVSEINK